jgi:hypothetical protein
MPDRKYGLKNTVKWIDCQGNNFVEDLTLLGDFRLK